MKAEDLISGVEMKIIVRTVLLLTFLALAASAAYSCECEFASAGKKLRRSKSVFVGEVVEIGPNDKSRWATVAVKFKVERFWKGVKEEFIVVVGAPAAAGACGLPVEVGKKYLIYAGRTEDGQLETSFCASRRLENAAEDLTVIGRGKKLKSK